MVEMFYGPWTVRLKLRDDPSHPQRVVITGSDNADGAYRFHPLLPFQLAVAGARWSISCELANMAPFPPVPEEVWDPRTVTRATRFDPKEGLTVELDANDPPRLSLICVSNDPEINPAQATNPFDFTLHG